MMAILKACFLCCALPISHLCAMKLNADMTASDSAIRPPKSHPANVSHPPTRKPPKIRAFRPVEKAIFVLSTLKDFKDRLPKMLRGLTTCSWLASVPVYVLVDEKPSPELTRAAMAAWPNVSVIDIRARGYWDPPDQYKTMKRFPGGGRQGLGYRLMCDLWSTKIMHLAKQLGVDFYMRLDTDSVLTCGTSAARMPRHAEAVDYVFGAERDLFDLVIDGGHAYGYWRQMRDDAFVSKHANTFIKSYAHDRALDLHDKIGSDLMAQGDDAGAMSYYNNFEIVNVAYFLRPYVQEFTDRVAASHGIYDYRWGDAVIRFWQVALFSTQHDVLCLSRALGFNYEHEHHVLGASCKIKR